MLAEVNPVLHDTTTAISDSTGTGVSGKIGVSSVVSNEPILITSNMSTDTIYKKLGKSPLADACIDAIDMGASVVHALPVKAERQGTVGKAVHTGTGTGTITTEGNPNNDLVLVVKIESSGEANAATCSISEDNGTTWGEEQTIPLSGKITLVNSGITLVFSVASTKYVEGDTYTFKATAPSANNQTILDAVSVFKNYKADMEWIHIVGTTTKALWASLEALAQQMEEEDRKPLFFLCEQRAANEGEDAQTYVDAILSDAKSIKGRHVVVCSQWATYTRLDGRVQDINLAGVFSGILAGLKESTSAAYPGEVSVSEEKILKLLPEGIERYVKELDEGRYVFFRKYSGLEGWYVATTNTTALESSNFSCVEDIRVAYRLVRQVSQRALLHQNMDYDQEDKEVVLKAVEKDLQVPVDKAKADTIISSGEVSIDMDSISDEGRKKVIPVSIRYVPRGYATVINLEFYVVNANS